VVIASAVRTPVTSGFVCHLIASFGFVNATRQQKSPAAVVRTGPGKELRPSSRCRSPHVHVRADDCDRSFGSAWALVLLSNRSRGRRALATARIGRRRNRKEDRETFRQLHRPPGGRRPVGGNYVVARPPKTAARAGDRGSTIIALPMPTPRTRRSGARQTAMCERVVMSIGDPAFQRRCED
jgi:hypothetical protein